jgi:hypothetical protein
MEAVTAYAALLITARYREATGWRLQRGMERRVKTPDLHHIRTKRQQCSGRRQTYLLMQRRHRGQECQFVEVLAIQP